MSFISPGGIALVEGQKGAVSTLLDHFWPDDDRPLVKITSKYKAPLVATADTKIETTSGWRYLKDLRVGDTFCVHPSACFGSDKQIPTFSYSWSRNLGRILGLLTVKGREFYASTGFRSRHSIGFHKDETPLAEQFGQWIQETLEIPTYTSPYIYNGTERIHLHVSPAHEMDGFFSYCVRNRVNPWLWTAPREAVLGFFEGILSGNGTMEAPKGDLYMVSTNETFAQELATLALYTLQLRLRIRTTPSTKTPDRTRYRLKLEQDNIPMFLAQVSLLRSDLRRKLEECKLHRRFYKDEYLDTIASVEPASLGPTYQLVSDASPVYVNGYRIQ